ncbi:unnamed protein product [Meganyctiphanes norvegica]|uniref:RNA polymerase II subunit A C-terminal domain phosphatase SSU72 n=1 Tax=Meganyctiphanes norvegica TaxID=48144 RepID=A0AAV2S319_MEGNR
MDDLDNLKFAVVCASNMNRSMEGHAFLAKKGYDVKSYGTGDKVKIPGATPDRPNVYEFGTAYDDIYQDLLRKDKNIYTQNGLLHMLDRNRRIKPKPEDFKTTKEQFNVIITCEERVYDKALECLEGRIPEENIPVHVINIDIEDNHEEATLGAFMICELAAKLSAADDLDDNIDEILHEFEVKSKRNILHSVQFY